MGTMKTAWIAMALVTLGAGAAQAGSVPDACEAAKHKEVGGLAKCLETAQGKLTTSGDNDGYAAAVTKCEAKFADKWTTAEAKAEAKGGECPSVGDQASILAGVHAHLDCVQTALETGNGSCLLCGNGVVDAGEDCDLGSEITGTCDTATGGLKPMGLLSCAAGCQYDTSGCGEGAIVGGHEWFLAADGQSCTAACTAHSRVYDDATLTYAGSGGTDANCMAVLAALGHPTIALSQSLSGSGLGCIYIVGSGFPINGLRDTSPTLANAAMTASGTTIQRACACKQP